MPRPIDGWIDRSLSSSFFSFLLAPLSIHSFFHPLTYLSSFLIPSYKCHHRLILALIDPQWRHGMACMTVLLLFPMWKYEPACSMSHTQAVWQCCVPLFFSFPDLAGICTTHICALVDFHAWAGKVAENGWASVWIAENIMQCLFVALVSWRSSLFGNWKQQEQ